MFMKSVLLVLSFIIIAAAAGCRHTAHGFGQDVEKVGQKIQEKTN